jgi:hypothetical protein
MSSIKGNHVRCAPEISFSRHFATPFRLSRLIYMSPIYPTTTTHLISTTCITTNQPSSTRRFSRTKQGWGTSVDLVSSKAEMECPSTQWSPDLGVLVSIWRRRLSGNIVHYLAARSPSGSGGVLCSIYFPSISVIADQPCSSLSMKWQNHYLVFRIAPWFTFV